MFQVEERGYYMKLNCSKGEGVTASLYKVLESLTSFDVKTSNLASTAEAFVLTVTLTVRVHSSYILFQFILPFLFFF